jgi:hypothetical protein
LHKRSNEVVRGYLDLITGRGWSSPVILIDLVGEQCVDEGIRALSEKVEQVLQKLILVLVGHALYGVCYLSGVMLDNELTLAGREVGVP